MTLVWGVHCLMSGEVLSPGSQDVRARKPNTDPEEGGAARQGEGDQKPCPSRGQRGLQVQRRALAHQPAPVPAGPPSQPHSARKGNGRRLSASESPLNHYCR